MALTDYVLTNSTWTLIGNNVTSISVQNSGSFPYYLNFNSSNTAPSETYGFIRRPNEEPLYKADVTTLTYKATPNFVFAKAVSANTKIIVETA